MADLTYNITQARPLHQAITVGPKYALSSGSLLDAVTINTDGKVVKSVNASGKCNAIVVSAGPYHKADGSYAANDALTLVTFGPVTGFSGLIPGRLVYLSATSGKLADTGSVPVGYAYDDTTVFFMPGVANAAS